MTDEIYLGLMSGTSLDAVDAVAVCFSPSLRILGSASRPMPEALREKLLALTQPAENEIDRMGELDNEVAELFASTAKDLMSFPELRDQTVTAIGSHGQTIRHRPYADRPFTLQIGNPNLIAELTGVTVVADFRRRDVAAGGQGAPLVPAFHEAIFRTTHCARIILNLGGMANITVLPKRAGATTYGFDTGPANVLMDAWCLRHQGDPFDLDGRWAASGQVIEPLLAEMLDHPFLHRTPPKSTGREDFHPRWLDRLLTNHPNHRTEDVQATLLELTARSISDAILTTGLEQGELWFCGGGAFNLQLRRRLAGLLPGFTQHLTDALGVDPRWVEATAFAWLARQTMIGQPGNLPAVTGAKGLRVLGGIYPP